MAIQEALQSRDRFASLKNFFRRKDNPVRSDFQTVLSKMRLRGSYDLFKGDYLDLDTDHSILQRDGGTEYNLFLYFHNEYPEMSFEEREAAKEKARGVHIRMVEGSSPITEVSFTDENGWRTLEEEGILAREPGKKLPFMVSSALLESVELPFDRQKNTVVVCQAEPTSSA